MDAELVEIGVVARELGVTTGRLRTWERRYRLVVAHRGARGQRLYDPGQIELLRRVVEEAGRGLPIQLALARALAPPPDRSLRIQLRHSSSAPQEARWAVDALLAGFADERFSFDLRLLTSEFVTNVVLYDAPPDPIQLEVRLFDDAADVRVGCRLGSVKQLRARRRDDGHALEVLDAVAEIWAIERGASGSELTARLRVLHG